MIEVENKSTRKIIGQGVVLLPGQCFLVEHTEANRLSKMYPSELFLKEEKKVLKKKRAKNEG